MYTDMELPRYGGKALSMASMGSNCLFINSRYSSRI